MERTDDLDYAELVEDINYLLKPKRAKILLEGTYGACTLTVIFPDLDTIRAFQGTIHGAKTYLVGMKAGLDIGGLA